MAVSPQERQFLLSQVNLLAATDLQNLWVQASQRSDLDFAGLIKSAFPQLVDPYIAMAGQLAASWFEESDPASTYVAKTADMPDVLILEKSADWALGADADTAIGRLQGTAQRAIYNGARETTLTNVQVTTSRWARYASANACAFCKLMATRTEDLYTSENAALRVVGRGKDFSSNFNADGTRKAGGQAGGVKTRGSRKVGEKYHDDCHCVAVEVREGQTYEIPAHVQEWKATYADAWDAVPDGTSYKDNGVLKAVLSQWRQLDGSN